MFNIFNSTVNTKWTGSESNTSDIGYGEDYYDPKYIKTEDDLDDPDDD
jgi:hypothetical protein